MVSPATASNISNSSRGAPRGKPASSSPGRDERTLQVHVAMLGARQHYAVPKLLHESGMLARFYTDLYARDAQWAVRLLAVMPRGLRPKAVERYLARSEKQLPSDKVISFDAFGLRYVWRLRRARDVRARNRVYAEGARSFNRMTIQHGLSNADVLYGFNSASLELFEYAKDQGISCILEQTIVPQTVVRELLKQELERWPGWEDGLVLDSDDGILDLREQKEWDMADLIVGGSPYVIEGLGCHHVAVDKCRVVPYGISLKNFSPVGPRDFSSSPKLRVLFAGGVELRKGAPYLLEALRILNSPHIEARFAGQLLLNRSRLKPYDGIAKFLGSVSRTHMVDLYGWADLFVLPSICEGSALSTYEALVSGVPVIATPNTGAWIRDGIDGVVIPIRNVEALAAALERFARDREFLRFCSDSAVEGRDRLGLEAYRMRLVEIVQDVVKKRHGHAEL